MVKRPWYKEKPKLFEIIKDEVRLSYPQLDFFVENDIVYLRGPFLLIDGERTIDTFLMEIVFPPRYPKGIPKVFETGGRIPRTPERHTYSSGEACLCFPLEISDAFPESSKFLDFLNGPVKSFFVSQSYYELTGKWLFGEWAHGNNALFEFCGPILKTRDRPQILMFLQIAKKKEIKGHWVCPCGSGKLLRHCHYGEVLQLHQAYQHAKNCWGRDVLDQMIKI